MDYFVNDDMLPSFFSLRKPIVGYVDPDFAIFSIYDDLADVFLLCTIFKSDLIDPMR